MGKQSLEINDYSQALYIHSKVFLHTSGDGQGPKADATFLIPRDNRLGITVDVLNNQTLVK